MAQRPRRQRRSQDFKRGVVARWPSDRPPAQEIALQARYTPSGEHKSYASPEGLWTFSPRTDKAKCDRFPESVWPELVALLQRAIEKAVVSDEFRGDFPARVWAYINDVLHEARLTNQETGEYHGFPIEYAEQFPHDPQHLLSLAPRVTLPVD